MTIFGDWALWISPIVGIALESLIFRHYMSTHRPGPGMPFVHQSGLNPLQDAQLLGMLSTMLSVYRSSLADQPMKVVRLRVYGGMPQGVLISGVGDDIQQVVFNAATCHGAGLTEPGYPPPTGFPFGWQAHQTAKQIHVVDWRSRQFYNLFSINSWCCVRACPWCQPPPTMRD